MMKKIFYLMTMAVAMMTMVSCSNEEEVPCGKEYEVQASPSGQKESERTYRHCFPDKAWALIFCHSQHC